ncbi:MAG: YggT family protein [Candidatus Riflemargulisbacteria bacterium]
MITIIEIISLVFEVYKVLLIIRILLSWIPHNHYHYLVEKLYELTDPYLNLFRSLNLNFGGIDLSPIVAFFVLSFVQKLLLQILIF